MHCDLDFRNLLVTEDGRAVWLDFDRAIVLNEINEDALLEIKLNLTERHRMLFKWEPSSKRGNNFPVEAEDAAAVAATPAPKT